MIPFEEFKLRSEILLREIAEICASCGRDPADIKVLPVTKTLPAAAVDYVARLGWAAVGENRVQEAAEKRPLATGSLRWELIGHLQSNKAKLAVRHFDRIQSVDSEKLLAALDKAAAAERKKIPVLLQINAGDDPNKFGADVSDAARLLETALQQSGLEVQGLMTIAPLSADPAVAERTFEKLREIRDDLARRFAIGLPELSMGMSGDFAAAIRFGSTQVRVGTRLFGERPPLPRQIPDSP
jgi:PLP dependent protein